MRQTPEWARDPIPDVRFDRNAIELPRYADIERSARRDFQNMVGAYLNRQIDENELTRRFKRRLEVAETEAFVSGRRARGDTRTDISESEERMLAGRHARNMGYFRRFVADMKAGRGRMNYVQRAGLYANSLWSVFTRGETTDWDSPESQNARYVWILDPDAEHCPDCIDRARQSRDNDGFSWEEITELGWPGENTVCLTNCRCHIRVVKKAVVLPERFEDLDEAGNASDGLKTLEELLGGENFPLKIPAAGVPYTALSPVVVERSLERAQQPEQLAKRLPLIPAVLTKPLDVVGDENLRLFIGPGLEVLVGRDDDGLWKILALLLPGELRRAA